MAHETNEPTNSVDLTKGLRAAIEARLAMVGDRIQVETKAFAPPVDPATLARAERTLGHALPDVLRAFYTEHDGMKLSWVAPGSGERGTVEIVPLEEMFGGREGRTGEWDEDAFEGDLWHEDYEEDLDEDELAALKRLRPLEPRPWATCLDYSEEPPALFLVDRWNLHPLGVSVAEYLEALVTCLGLQGWRAELRGTSEAASFRERAAAIFTADALGASIFGRLPRRAPDSERW